MGDIALLTVIGRLTKDATCEALPNNAGRFIVKFTTASSYYVRGQQDRPSAFYECRMFMGQERWNNVSQFLMKGRLVCVWGQLRPRLSTDQQGREKLWLNLEEVDFQPVGPKPEGATSAPPQQGGGYPQAQGYPAQAQGAGYPQAQGAPAGPPPGAEPALPPGWTQQTDPASQRPYYVGPQGQTQWEAPIAAPPAQGAPPATPPPATPPQNAPPGGQGGPPGYGGSPI